MTSHKRGGGGIHVVTLSGNGIGWVSTFVKSRVYITIKPTGWSEKKKVNRTFGQIRTNCMNFSKQIAEYSQIVFLVIGYEGGRGWGVRRFRHNFLRGGAKCDGRSSQKTRNFAWRHLRTASIGKWWSRHLVGWKHTELMTQKTASPFKKKNY